METLYDKASLVLNPGVYDTGKVYVTKPFDGSGDLTFSRASNATRVNSSGLVEKVRTNLITYSQDFSNAAWSAAAGVTLTHGQTDPNGGTTATKVDFSASGQAFEQVIGSLSTSHTYNFSIYVRCDSGTVDFQMGNLNATVFETRTATTSWQKFNITQTPSATTRYPRFVQGLSASTLYIAFAQLETGDIATDYIATTSAAVSVGPVSGLPRLDYSGGASCPSLLLEPQRVNYQIYSENSALWTQPADGLTVAYNTSETLDPSGYNGAEKVTAVSGNRRMFEAIANPAGAFTASAFVKAGTGNTFNLTTTSGSINVQFNLLTGSILNTTGTGSLVDYGNGWYRCIATGTSAGSEVIQYRFLNDAGEYMYFWGAQLEAGAYATSYIPTLGAAVTRVGDSCEKQSITSLIGQTAGTIYWESKQVGGAQISLNTTNSVISDGLQIYASGYNLAIYIQQGGTTHLSTVIGAVTEGTNFKIALAYGTNFVMAYINGVQTYTTTATIPMPTMTMLNLAFYGGGPTAAKSENKQVLLFNSILTPSELATLTA